LSPKRLDCLGRPIRRGDWVRLVEIPRAVVTMGPPETRRVFRLARGKTFRVEGFGRHGHAELDVGRKVRRLETIWVEPDCLRLFRRVRRKAPSRRRPVS
jgi:hypothetical protein